MDFKDYYAVMGVSREATQDDIRRAYRKLARKYHPDVSQEVDAEQRFKEVGEAYEVLKDPEKRAAYDQLGANWQQGQPFQAPPGWDAGFEFAGGFEPRGEDGAHFSDFFEALFGQGGFAGQGYTRHRAQSARGEDHHAHIEIALEDAFHGATRTFRLHLPSYDAAGRLVHSDRTIQVKIPRGVTAGKRIRLPGQGGAAPIDGAPAGDLYLEVSFSAHRQFEPEGADVRVTLPITPWEAALGARVPVPTLGGRVELTIPAGARSGQRLRLKGRGLPKPQGSAGDQFVVLTVEAPKPMNEDQESAYRHLAAVFDGNPRAENAA